MDVVGDLDEDVLLATKLCDTALETPPSNCHSPLISPTSAETATSTPPSIPPHRSHDPTANIKRADPFQFGQRYLQEDDDVFEYNAWDHVTPDPSHVAYCDLQYAAQRSSPVSDFDKLRFNTNPQKWWDLFYKQKTSTFFKDRKWLRQEFPILDEVSKVCAGRKVVLEVGAGAGNTAFPILRENKNPALMVHAYDFSSRAVETMRRSEEYDERFIRAEVWDVAATEDTQGAGLPPALEEGSVDVVIMIFVFSALSPEQWEQGVKNIFRVLKPGGEVLFRDYGRGDLAQVRFKAGRWMDDNFYVRGDGTRVYFFETEELHGIWGGCQQEGKRGDLLENAHSLPRTIGDTHIDLEDEIGNGMAKSRFDILNLDLDRRLIVNRQRKIKMYRCWIQGRFRKPPHQCKRS